MESAANLHQHQNQLLVGSSSLADPSFHGVEPVHAMILNANPSSNIAYVSNGINSRDPRPQNGIFLVSPFHGSASTTPDLGLPWANNNTEASFIGQSATHDLQLANIKEELSDSYPRFTEMINSSPSSSGEDLNSGAANFMKNEHKDYNMSDLNAKLLLKTFSSGCQLSPGEFYSSSSYPSRLGSLAADNRGSFSQILPSINVSNFHQPSLANSRSLDMNMQALDLFNSARLTDQSLSQTSYDQLGLGFPKQGFSNYGFDHMQQSSQRALSSPSKLSSSNSSPSDSKRSSTILEQKPLQAASKKSRSESRTPCPPFKVRKEKLGDRIAALQQLVAPFGKTDTASVLMEAIGYIKFLQNQVETLSVPYMKSSHKKISRGIQQGANPGDEDQLSKRDLRSRGLCLVPLSCLSYVTESGGAVWPPPNFGGGT